MSNIAELKELLEHLAGEPDTVVVVKPLAATEDYTAEDVMSESATGGTAWHLEGMANDSNQGGVIEKAIALCTNTALTPRLTFLLFRETPTCALNDNVANTAVIATDATTCEGWIDFPAMEDLGTGMSQTLAVGSTYGNLLLPYRCGSSRDLYGVVVTRDGITTETPGMKLYIILQIRKF